MSSSERIISFRISKDVFDKLRSRKKTFRSIFEPIAVQLTQNNRGGTRKHSCKQTIPMNLYTHLGRIQKELEKILNEAKQ